MNIAILYILLWYVGAMQAMYITSSALSLSLSVPFMLISCYYAYLTMTKYSENRYMRMLSCFFVMLLIYGLIYFLIGENVFLHYRVRRKTEFILAIINSLGPIFAFYVMTIKGKLNNKTFIWWIIPFLILTTLEYNKTIEDLALRFYNVDSEEFTNNTGYLFLSLTPFVFLLNKKPLFQYLLLGYTLFFTVSSMKRGAIIIGIFVLLWYIKQNFNMISPKKKMYMYILTLLFIIVGIYFINNLLTTSVFFQLRVQQTLEGDSSSRDAIYSSLINTFFQDASIIQLLFGYGADGTIAISGNLAHSDWLEILVNCGFIGVLLYVSYWIYFIKEWKKTKQDHLVYSILGICLIFTFIKSIFSMSYDCMSFYMSMFIGYGMGILYLTKYKNKYHQNEKCITSNA